MTHDEVVELIKLIPGVLWVLFAAVTLGIFYRPIRYELIPKLTTIKLPGVEATFAARQELDKAAHEQSAQAGGDVSESDRSQVLRRAARNFIALQGANVLWVDDNPDNNLYLRRTLVTLGIRVDIARSTSEALSALSKVDYDLIISDMKRGNVEDEGVRFLNEIRRRRVTTTLVFYAAGYDPARGIPPYAFGMTNRYDELLHYVMDVLETVRG